MSKASVGGPRPSTTPIDERYFRGKDDQVTSRSPVTRPPRADGTERYRRLLEAHHRISDDLSLASVLDQTVGAACELVGAQYGALGIVAADGSIEHVAQRGLDERSVERVGRLPRGGGLLGASLSTPGPVRLDDLTTDARYYATPTARPTMRSFLAVPIRGHGVTLGELYVADPLAGRFDAEDEDLVVSLAATAGNAVENSRLYDDAQRSRDWLNASGEIARALLADDDEEVLLDVVTRALSIAEADLACLILPTDNQHLRLRSPAASAPRSSRASCSTRPSRRWPGRSWPRRASTPPT